MTKPVNSPTPLRSIPVFFQPEMAADANSYSPSAGKPPLAVADWLAYGLPIDVRCFDPVDEDTLSLAHDRDYVRGVLRGEITNGFGNKRPSVAATLRHTTGAMLAAAEASSGPGWSRPDVWCWIHGVPSLRMIASVPSPQCWSRSRMPTSETLSSSLSASAVTISPLNVQKPAASA